MKYTARSYKNQPNTKWDKTKYRLGHKCRAGELVIEEEIHIGLHPQPMSLLSQIIMSYDVWDPVIKGNLLSRCPIYEIWVLFGVRSKEGKGPWN